ncbi:hypothetical protein B296_00024680 [Ensete ventricosum]|uniref:Uncharacterized protein n=1 Tax=Ensete ventricosum TaxID=4639 RepID=A0A427AUH5_ENSVE|nr:hypothetical protein B296_00024680 [Ensete ventricosum]
MLQRRLNHMLYIGLTEEHKKSATMFAKLVGAQVLSQSEALNSDFKQAISNETGDSKKGGVGVRALKLEFGVDCYCLLAISNRLARYRRYIPVRPLPGSSPIGAVSASLPPEIDRRSLSGGNGRFRSSPTDFGRYQRREKEEEGEEKGERGDPALLSQSRSPAGFSVSRGDFFSPHRLLGEKTFLLPARGEEMSVHLGIPLDTVVSYHTELSSKRRYGTK